MQLLFETVGHFQLYQLEHKQTEFKEDIRKFLTEINYKLELESLKLGHIKMQMGYSSYSEECRKKNVELDSFRPRWFIL